MNADYLNSGWKFIYNFTYDLIQKILKNAPLIICTLTDAHVYQNARHIINKKSVINYKVTYITNGIYTE